MVHIFISNMSGLEDLPSTKYKNIKLWLYFLSKLAVHGQNNLQCEPGFMAIVIAQS